MKIYTFRKSKGPTNPYFKERLYFIYRGKSLYKPHVTPNRLLIHSLIKQLKL